MSGVALHTTLVQFGAIESSVVLVLGSVTCYSVIDVTCFVLFYLAWTSLGATTRPFSSLDVLFIVLMQFFDELLGVSSLWFCW
ncbi:hypothetical protein A2U01_0065533 [Trifolium medium]|uniref:Uncharacterized protein n=1 Tax=Trifolium medium TaxID=97028 RepID=A0A392S7X1_9FABA|nr:hypothetical protein [Trifolium medium]